VDRITPRKVYVVDDDDAVRDSMRALLEASGIEVRDYASARDFLYSGCRNSDGCLLLDLHMPGMGGIELLELLRAEGCELPVIVITGRSDPTVKERVIRAGAQNVLEKPVDEAVLMNALDRASHYKPASREQLFPIAKENSKERPS
jgi:two-component system CheB/CheR fusion protein